MTKSQNQLLIKTKIRLLILIFIITLLVIIGLLIFVFLTKKQPTVSNPFPISPTLLPTSLLPTSSPDENKNNLTNKNYPLPSTWQKYTDNDAGITIYYPPEYTPKYNSNRGVGINYAAGSYLLNSKGEKILDFYWIPYDGGSRRKAFYKIAEFDGPEDMSQYTVATSDVILNGKSFLKLISNYWEKINGEDKRVFFFIPQGKRMYYFTYPLSIEKDGFVFKNVLTIIANSIFFASSDETVSQKNIFCYPRPTLENKEVYWEANLDNEGNMLVIQRTDKLIKKDVDKTKVSILGNPQDGSFKYFSILDFDFYVDPSLKNSFSGAFVIKIKKQDVEKIIQQTPPSIPSIAIIVSINGAIETETGERCSHNLEGYFATR